MSPQRRPRGSDSLTPVNDAPSAFKQKASALFASSRVVVTVEERALLGDHQLALSSLALQLHGRQRHRDFLLVEMHLVTIDQPLVRDHVVVDGVERGHHSSFPTTLQPLLAADTHVHMPFEQLPSAGRSSEPFLLGPLVGQRLPHPRNRCVIGAREMKRGVRHRAGASPVPP